MTSPIDPITREILQGVFDSFEMGRDSNSTLDEVVLTKIRQLKDVFQIDLEREFSELRFFKNTKIAELSTREREIVEGIFSRVLGTRLKSSSEGSVSPSTTSIDSPETVAMVEEHLKQKRLSIEGVRESGYAYQAAMRESLTMFFQQNRKKLDLEALPIAPTDDELVLVEGGEIRAPEQFAKDHMGSRKNKYMRFSFSGSPDRSIGNQNDLLDFNENVTTFTERVIPGKEATAKREKVRSAILFFCSQHVPNCVAQPFAALETECRSRYENLPSFQVGPTDAKYSFEPILDQDGNIVPNQFKMNVRVHVAAFQSIQLDGASEDEVEMFQEGREELGIGEVAATEVDGSYIVSIDEKGEISVTNLKMTYSLTFPPLDEVDRAKAIIEEATEKPMEEIQRERKEVEEAIRRELEFLPFEKEKRLANFAFDVEAFIPTEEELALQEHAPMPLELERVPFTSEREEKMAREVAGYFSSGGAHRILQVPYRGYVDPAIPAKTRIKTTTTEESCRISPVVTVDGIIIPNQFEVSLRASYLTEREWTRDSSMEHRVEAAKRILCEEDREGFGTAPLLDGEARAVFIVHVGAEVVIDTVETSYTAKFQKAPEPFVDVVEEAIDNNFFVEEALKHDQIETDKKEALTLQEVQEATTMFKGAVQKKRNLQPQVETSLSPAELSLDLEGFAPSQEAEAGALEAFAVDFERDRKSDYKQLQVGEEPPIRIKKPRDARMFKGEVADFAMEIGSSPKNRQSIKDAILLFSTQHIENRLCGPYNMFVIEEMGQIDQEKKLATEQINVEVSFKPVQGRQGIERDQFQVTFRGEYATMYEIYRDPSKVDNQRFIRAREEMGIGAVLNGKIEATFIVSLSEEGEISIKNLKTRYSIESPR